MTDVHDALRRLSTALDAATTRRPVSPATRWMPRERAAMLAEVNVIRAERGTSPATAEDVAHCDRMATGHVDWATKFPLYCAELALDERPRP